MDRLQMLVDMLRGTRQVYEPPQQVGLLGNVQPNSLLNPATVNPLMARQFNNQALGQIANRYPGQVRNPYQGERDYFQSNPQVGGMMSQAGDPTVTLNPFAPLAPTERDAVARNEMARVHMRDNMRPSFAITPQQRGLLAGTTYQGAPDQDVRETIAARLYSGDPSGGNPSEEQASFIAALRKALGR